MTSYFPNPTRVLKDGVGDPIAGAVVERVSWKANEGWKVSAYFHGAFDMYQSIDTPYTLDFTDGLGHSQSTPVLCPAQREHEDEDSVDGGPDLTPVEFEDLSSFKMRRPNQNFASFVASSTGAMIDALATRAGVTINGDPDLYVSEDEAKGAKLAEVLDRIRKISACDLVVLPDGSINLEPWEDDPGDLVFAWSKRRHRVDARNIYSGQRLGKSTSKPPSGEQIYGWTEAGFVSQALDAPLFGAEADDISVTGLCGSFTTWDGDPGNPLSGWLNHQDLEGLGNYDPPETAMGSGVATHFTAVILPPGGVFSGSSLTTAVSIRVTGTPEEELPEGVDAEFLYPAVVEGTDTSLGDWPAPDFIDSLFPSQSYAVSRRPYILRQLNGPADTLTLTGPLQCGTAIQLLLEYSYNSKTYKVMSIEWDFVGNRTTIVLHRKGGE